MAFGEQLQLAVLIKTVSDLTGAQTAKTGLAGVQQQAASLNAQLGQMAASSALALGTMMGNELKTGMQNYVAYETVLRQIRYQGGLTADQIKETDQALQDLNETTLGSRFNIQQLALAYEALASEGLSSSETITIMEASMARSLGTGEDLAATSAQLYAIMEMYGMSVEKADDISAKFYQTMLQTDTKEGDIAEAMFKTAGAFTAMGMSVEETMVILGTLLDATGGNARAAQGLTSAFVELANSESEVSKKALAAGVDVQKIIASGGDMVDVLMALSRIDPNLLVEIFGSPQAVAAVNQMLMNTGQLEANIAAVEAANAQTVGPQQQATVQGGKEASLEQLQYEYYSFWVSTGKAVYEAIEPLLPYLEAYLHQVGKLDIGTRMNPIGSIFNKTVGAGVGAITDKANNTFNINIQNPVVWTEEGVNKMMGQVNEQVRRWGSD